MKLPGCFRLALPVLLLMFVSGCALHGEGIHGTVREGDGASSNAFVIAKWDGVIPRPAEGADVCLHTSITKTDADGNFELPGWWNPLSLLNLVPIIKRSTGISVYKPGFESRPGDGFMFRDGGRISLARSVRTPEEQLYTLGYYAEDGVSCTHGKDDAEDAQHVMRAYYEALAEEVHQLGIQSKESDRIAAILKDKLYPQRHVEQPIRVQMYQPPSAPTGKVAPAPLQGAVPVPSSNAQLTK